jgi:hypothetical protein
VTDWLDEEVGCNPIEEGQSKKESTIVEVFLEDFNETIRKLVSRKVSYIELGIFCRLG